MDEEIRIEARVRNNRLYRAIFDKWPSVAAFCRDENYSQVIIGKLLNLKMNPLTKKGEYRKVCIDIAKDLGYLVDELFPLPLYGIKAQEAAFEISLSQLPDGDNLIRSLPDITENTLGQLESAEKVGLVMKVMSKLSKQDVELLKMRFGIDYEEHTFWEIGERLEVSRNTARWFFLKALFRAQEELEKLTRSEKLQASRERIVRYV